MAQKQRNEGDGPIDPMLTPDLIEDSSPESLGVKWLQAMGADSSLPSICQGSGFKEALILRHLKVDRVEPGLVLFTLTVKPPITNRYHTLHGGAVATVAGIVAMAAVKTISGDKTYSLSEMSISYVSAARINVELEIEAKVLRFGKSIAVSSIDIRNKKTKQITFQGRATFLSYANIKSMINIYVLYERELLTNKNEKTNVKDYERTNISKILQSMPISSLKHVGLAWKTTLQLLCIDDLLIQAYFISPSITVY